LSRGIDKNCNLSIVKAVSSLRKGEKMPGAMTLDRVNDAETEEKEKLDRFFAVTKTSVYRVESEKDENRDPIVEKIALRGVSRLSVGGRLHNGDFVGIMKAGLVLYIEDHPKSGRIQKPEEVNTAFWGGHTSAIVGLFLEKDDAMNCNHTPFLQICDPRWRKETEKTLRAIGENHPVFILSLWDPISYD